MRLLKFKRRMRRRESEAERLASEYRRRSALRPIRAGLDDAMEEIRDLYGGGQ